VGQCVDCGEVIYDCDVECENCGCPVEDNTENAASELEGPYDVMYRTAEGEEFATRYDTRQEALYKMESLQDNGLIAWTTPVK
jgi:hypothetical protein